MKAGVLFEEEIAQIVVCHRYKLANNTVLQVQWIFN
jgi:hypothetical protein